ncbi:hypothetical protein KDW_64330 [Dictyobacter vulcani]|uniref:Uncharacterized protein n=1 Tax=Dictyobacter vulcani TaxID=2607529 RepID=A0A5J4L0H3_9CHLR|nr:hypothetical protein KDW_64330 [Dictyobacter vulcani]
MHIAIEAGAHKLLYELLLLLTRWREAQALLTQMLAGTAQHLATVDLTLLDHGRDFGVLIVKDIAQQKHRSLQRSQFLQHDQERIGERLVLDHALEEFGIAVVGERSWTTLSKSSG